MKTLIIGSGFSGSAFQLIQNNSFCSELPHLCSGREIPFDMNDRQTWQNLPDFDQCLITCKITARKNAGLFVKFLNNRPTILLSTAKCLINERPDGIINEYSPLVDSPRNIAEAPFAEFCCIMHLGLIWGKHRSILQWLKNGRIKNGRKLVNLIYIEDLADICRIFLKNNAPAGRYLISDGRAQRWQTLADQFKLQLSSDECGTESRSFDTAKMQGILPKSFCFKRPV